MIVDINNNIHINGSIINLHYVYNIGEVLCVIPFTDFVLIKCFGSRARWFQLHSAINFFITYLIRNEIYSFIFYPLYAIRVNTDYKVVYYIIYLHDTMTDWYTHRINARNSYPWGCISFIKLESWTSTIFHSIVPE